MKGHSEQGLIFRSVKLEGEMYENTTRRRELSNPELVRVEPLPI